MGLNKSISQALQGKYFNLAVDLGCGPGFHGEVIKPHVKYLIGVDHHYGRLNVALKFAGYDKVVLSDVRDYPIPPETEAVFIFEVIEHLTKQEGLKLLKRISSIPFILLSTPATFFETSAMNHHISLWTPDELTTLGLKTEIIDYDFPSNLRGVRGIFAVKEVR